MLLSRYPMNLNDQAFNDNTTKAMPYKDKGVFLTQLPLATVDQDQTNTRLNDHIIAMCATLSTINMKRCAYYKFCTSHKCKWMPPICLSSKYLQLTHRHLKRTIYNEFYRLDGIYSLDLNSSPVCLPQRHAYGSYNIFETPIFLVLSL